MQLRLSQPDRRRYRARFLASTFRARARGLMRLDNLVKVAPAKSASRIDRLDRQRQVSLRAQIAPGYALADRLEALNQAVREMNLPAEYFDHRIRAAAVNWSAHLPSLYGRFCFRSSSCT